MLQILLSERHPEAGALNRGVVNHQALYLLVVQQVAVPRADVRVSQVLVNLQRLRLHPLSVLPVESLLRNLADVDLRVEVRGKRLVVVARVTVHDVQILNLLEVVLGGIGRVDARHARVESATQDGRQPRLLETLAVGPLP